MCGIGGVSLRPGASIEPDFPRRLAAALRHRGPDGDGMHLTERVALVHRRLSIIDVAGGRQPISDRDGQVHIVVNGEIYNYRDLQIELRAEGIALTTDSDSECPLHLYKKHGIDFVHFLRGMYALAIHDARSGDLVLARDPYGIKPLYYAQTAMGFAFASEPAALIEAGWMSACVAHEHLPYFFNHQFCAGRATLFAGILRLLPGELCVIRDGAVIERHQHRAELHPADAADAAEAETQFEGLFEAAVRTHLQSEVPYGVFVSGGIDSALIAHEVARLNTAPVRTFTVGFEDPSVGDERGDAERLASRLGTEHTAVSFTAEDFWRYLPVMCTAFDDLVADYACLPMLKLAEAARASVKVVLTGEGGDEIFAGYGRYRRLWWNRLRRRPIRAAGAAEFADLFRIDVRDVAVTESPFATGGFTALQMSQARDIADWLPDDLLLKTDRCLMHFGIEGRVPYLDGALAAFGFALPDRLKVRGRYGKWLIRECLERRDAGVAVWRHKRGLTVPVTAWLNAGRDRLLETFHRHAGIEDIVHPDRLERLLREPMTRKQAVLVFRLLCYALWHDIQIAKRAPSLGV